MHKLSPRQQAILNRVVEAHIETALPVPPLSITALYRDLYHDSYSPATVRNEMGFLEEKGYLTHPHTSAGRVPTDRGYRYYVDYGLRQENLPDNLFASVKAGVLQSGDETEQLTEKISQLLSTFLKEVIIFISPAAPGSNANAEPLRLRWMIKGVSHILEKPEFQNLEKVKALFQALEEKIQLGQWLMNRQQNHRDVLVSIGQENQPESLHDCAVVSTSYFSKNQGVGILAVIGPKRMKYSWAIPLVLEMGKVISHAFKFFDSNEDR